jgi:AcrR family transcriptional regulator
MADGYPRKRAQTRQRLIEAGMTVLAQRGPDGARVAEVAAEAGVAAGTFYNHFASLDELLEAVTAQLAAGVVLGGSTLAAIGDDPALRVALGTHQLLDLARTDRRAAAAFVSLLATVAPFRRRVRHLVAGAVGDGVRAGRFAVANVEAATDACLGAAVQWMRSQLTGEDPVSTERDRLAIMLSIVGMPAEAAETIVDQVLAHRPAGEPGIGDTLVAAR